MRNEERGARGRSLSSPVDVVVAAPHRSPRRPLPFDRSPSPASPDCYRLSAPSLAEAVAVLWPCGRKPPRPRLPSNGPSPALRPWRQLALTNARSISAPPESLSVPRPNARPQGRDATEARQPAERREPQPLTRPAAIAPLSPVAAASGQPAWLSHSRHVELEKNGEEGKEEEKRGKGGKRSSELSPPVELLESTRSSGPQATAELAHRLRQRALCGQRCHRWLASLVDRTGRAQARASDKSQAAPVRSLRTTLVTTRGRRHLHIDTSHSSQPSNHPCATAPHDAPSHSDHADMQHAALPSIADCTIVIPLTFSHLSPSEPLRCVFALRSLPPLTKCKSDMHHRVLYRARYLPVPSIEFAFRGGAPQIGPGRVRTVGCTGGDRWAVRRPRVWRRLERWSRRTPQTVPEMGCQRCGVVDGSTSLRSASAADAPFTSP